MSDFDYLRDGLEPIFKHYGVRRAILFGSFAKGNQNAKSDVDICVDSGLRGLKFVGLMEAVRKALGDRDVDLLDVAHINNGSDVAKEIERTGVLLYEG